MFKILKRNIVFESCLKPDVLNMSTLVHVTSTVKVVL